MQMGCIHRRSGKRDWTSPESYTPVSLCLFNSTVDAMQRFILMEYENDEVNKGSNSRKPVNNGREEILKEMCEVF